MSLLSLLKTLSPLISDGTLGIGKPAKHSGQIFIIFTLYFSNNVTSSGVRLFPPEYFTLSPNKQALIRTLIFFFLHFPYIYYT